MTYSAHYLSIQHSHGASWDDSWHKHWPSTSEWLHFRLERKKHRGKKKQKNFHSQQQWRVGVKLLLFVWYIFCSICWKIGKQSTTAAFFNTLCNENKGVVCVFLALNSQAKNLTSGVALRTGSSVWISQGWGPLRNTFLKLKDTYDYDQQS